MAAADNLESVMARLSAEQQQEVLAYAQRLLEPAPQAGEAPARPRFYICPVCFAAADEPVECHGHLMVACDAANPEDCKPLMDDQGNLKSRAPRWFVTLIADYFDRVPGEGGAKPA